jgi:sugar lactone lactonase YvrE
MSEQGVANGLRRCCRSTTRRPKEPRKCRAILRLLPLLFPVGLALLAPEVAAEEPRRVQLPTQAPERLSGTLEVVTNFNGAMPYGVTVSREGRIFVCFPRRGDEVPATVVELKDGRSVPYPDAEINRFNKAYPSECFVSVQGILMDAKDRLWIFDIGYVNSGTARPGGPKLVCIDLRRDQVEKTIVLPSEVVLPATFLNEGRIHLKRGKEGIALIADSGTNAFIVVDLATGEAWRRLTDHPSTKPEPGFLPILEGQPLFIRPPDRRPTPLAYGICATAIGHDGKRLYYSALCSRRLYSIDVDALCDRKLTEEQLASYVIDHGEKGGGGGIQADAEGRQYLTNYEHNSVLRRLADGTFETLISDPRLLWPDTLYLADDGYMYLICNQLHRQAAFHGGKDLREKPYSLFRFRCDGTRTSQN